MSDDLKGQARRDYWQEKFRWPQPDEEVMRLSVEQINWLLDGYDISLLKGHKKLHYEALF